MNDVIIIDCICIEFAVMKLIMNDDDDDDELMNDNIQEKIVDYFISMVINKKKK